jgi:hypothetical protein
VWLVLLRVEANDGGSRDVSFFLRISSILSVIRDWVLAKLAWLAMSFIMSSSTTEFLAMGRRIILLPSYLCLNHVEFDLHIFLF